MSNNEYIRKGDIIVYPNGYPNGKIIENPVNIKLIKDFGIMGQTHFIGKAGQMAVMAEIALRGYNVAMPEIDTGDDIFVVNDVTGNMYRLQVKTSLGKSQKKSHSCQFSIRLNQITEAQTPELYFVFVTRIKSDWKYVVLDRSILKHLMENESVGSKSKHQGNIDYLQMTMTFHNSGDVICSKKKLNSYLNNWDTWKPILKKE